MLSVYYHALGRQLELRGAPAVLLPSDVEPIPLGEALDTLGYATSEFRAAIWTLARGMGPQASFGKINLARYPPALVEAMTRAGMLKQFKKFEKARRAYRHDAHRLGDVLTAYANGVSRKAFYAEIKALRPQEFSQAIQDVGALGSFEGQRSDIESFLLHLAHKSGDSRTFAVEALRRLSEEVGLPLTTIMEEFSSAVAFEECFPQETHRHPMTIFPTSSVTVQDARSLITTVTVTALVRTTDFRMLSVSMDPQCWMRCSKAFKESSYLDPTDFKTRVPREPGDLGTSYRKPPPSQLLWEHVLVAWGLSNQELGEFDNILNVTFEEDRTYPARVTLNFDLHRCVSSRILWDVRPGGILIDEGYAKARQVAGDLFRVTVRKTLRFSDRTPNSGGRGWHDFGQVLNFLAPAAMSWWLESEMYNQNCAEIVELASESAIPVPPVPRAELPDAPVGRGGPE